MKATVVLTFESVAAASEWRAWFSDGGGYDGWYDAADFHDIPSGERGVKVGAVVASAPPKKREGRR